MLKKQTPSEKEIIDCLATHYSIKIDVLTFLPLGADANASVYKADARDQKSYFLKLKRNYNHEMSVAISKLLYENGFTHVILPIDSVHDEQAQPIDDFVLIVYPFIEGEDGFHRDLTNEQWRMLGKALRQVHEIAVPPSIEKQIRRETYSNRWRQEVRSLLDGGEIAPELQTFFREKREIVRKILDRAEELSQKVKEASAKIVLCHADIHGGNVIIDDNDSIYLVDWDDPMMAPKERDLMFIGGGVANVWNKPHEEEFFYMGYGKTEVNREILAYYRCERILEDIVLLNQELRSTNLATSDKQKIYKWFVDQFCPNGVVDMAFKTEIKK